MFLGRLAKSLADGKPFEKDAFEQDIRAWEEGWTRQTESYPALPQGDPVAVSRRLWQKYRNDYRKAFEPDAVSLSTGKPADFILESLATNQPP